MENDVLLCWILLACLIMLLWCYTKPTQEGYGSHYQPEIEENNLLMRGPWDHVDYINPVLLTNGPQRLTV
jgi:hypothetical protein